jgi:hypothetical protein
LTPQQGLVTVPAAGDAGLEGEHLYHQLVAGVAGVVRKPGRRITIARGLPNPIRSPMECSTSNNVGASTSSASRQMEDAEQKFIQA